jgi:hypothetical protein
MGAVRRSVRSLTCLALSALLWSVALPVAETHVVGDPDAAAFEWIGSASGGPGVESVSDVSAAPEHCVLCHWQRAVSGASLNGAAIVATPAAVPLPGTRISPRFSAPASAAHPSRAPPVPV